MPIPVPPQALLGFAKGAFRFLFSRWGIILMLSLTVAYLSWMNDKKSHEIELLDLRIEEVQEDLRVSQANLEAKKREFEYITQLKDDLENSYKDLQERHENLSGRFNKMRGNGTKRDIGALALAKPGLLEKIINNGSEEAIRCIEIVSGSTLTEEELAATKRSQINSLCPEIANPNYEVSE